MDTNLSELNYGVAFSCVAYSIQHKICEFTLATVSRIRNIHNLLEDISSELEGRFDYEGKEEYTFSTIRGFREILQTAGCDLSDVSRGGVDKMKEKLEERIKQLEQLKKNPCEFYEGKESRELLNFCDSMKNLYTKSLKIFR